MLSLMLEREMMSSETWTPFMDVGFPWIWFVVFGVKGIFGIMWSWLKVILRLFP